MVKFELNESLNTKVSKGVVYIAGSGPGSPLLLTIQCFQLIKECDVVIYDRLVPDDIINIIPQYSEKIFAGKSCNNHYMTQDEINETLAKKALLGKSVLRLKGGDPLIFGRGSEEALYLSNRKIPFKFIPGINSAIGCSTYCGIPLTHRGISNGVTFITGHKQNGNDIDYDWKSLATSNNTLVIYMGIKNIELITSKLLENGMKATTPVAVIERGTTSNQKLLTSTLLNTSKNLIENDIKAPSIIIIGDVVSIRSDLSNYC